MVMSEAAEKFHRTQDVQEAVRKRLGRDPEPWAWGQAEELEFVEDARIEGPNSESFDSLLTHIRAFEGRPAGVGSDRRRGLARLELPPDRRTTAIVEIQAAEAGRLDAVKELRTEVLRGKLINPEELVAWLQQRGHDRDQATLRRSEYVEPDGTVVPPCQAFPKTTEPVSLRFALYTTKGPARGSVYIRVDSDLGRLKQVALELTSAYGWKEEYAVPFIVCGAVPPASRAMCEVSYVNHHNTGLFYAQRVEIVCHPSTRPDVVANLYARARKSIGQRYRKLSDKHIELAVFVAQRNDGKRWATVWDDWIDTHPEFDHPQDLSNFTRDCHQAYRRVMENRLLWAGGRSGAKS